MKLITCSIVFGVLGILLSALLLNTIGNQVSGTGILAIGLFCFFCPGLYVLNKIYNNIKKE